MVFLRRTDGRAGGDQLAGTAKQISRGLQRGHLRPSRTHRLALFLSRLLLLHLLPLHITRCTLTLVLSLSLFRSRFLLHSTAFIIKIKCKIVPRTSFPNGIKLRARISLSLHYHYTRGRIDPSFLDRVVPSRFIYSSRANERAVFPRRDSRFKLSISRSNVKVLRAWKAIRDPIFGSFKRALRI
jgi:hypothetical protein